MKVLFLDSDPTEISLYPTDSEEDVLTRLAAARNVPSVLFPRDFSWFQFLKQQPLEALDLFSILPPTMEYAKALQLYKKIQKRYDVPIDLFTEMWVARILGDKIDPLVLKAVQFSIPFEWIAKSHGKDKTLLQNWWAMAKSDEFWVSKLAGNQKRIQDAIQRDKKNQSMAQMFQETEPLPVLEEKEIGYITQFHVKTTKTAGILFNHIDATHDMPVIRYKTFHKMFTAPGATTLPKDDMAAPHFHDCIVYNRDGDVSIHVKTTSGGLLVQALILYDSRLSAIDAVKDYLGLQETEEDIQRFGLRIQFYVDNVCIDPSVFSDMVMNNDLFRRFLAVNDTDKISRNNKSVFLYFHDDQIEKVIDPSDILVGGWNRAFSRYGDLTAILSCEPTKDHYRVLVRVSRSLQEDTVSSFQSKIAKLLRVYTKELDSFEKLYKKLIPKFSLYFPPLVVSKTMDDPLSKLMAMEPDIFISNIYGRNCQKVKPIVVDDPALMESLPPERKLIFPPVPYKTFQPRCYTCPLEEYEKEGVAYKYPGLKKIKKSDHPFGYFPCCYIENWEAKNKKISEQIKKKIKGEITEVKLKKSIDHIIKTSKIIDNLGQLGTLPEPLEQFFLCMDPSREYFRVGVGLVDSLLLCMEYQHAERNSSPMRDPMTVRGMMAQASLEIGEQQNYDLSVEQVRDMLLDKDYSLEPERFWRILENFYQVTLCLFSRDKQNRIHITMPRHDRSLYRYADPLRPIVAIYRHWGGAMDDLLQMKEPHCELIMGRKFNNVRNFVFSKDRSGWNYISDFGMAFFDGEHAVVPLSIEDGHLSEEITAQWIDSIGKARIFFFSTMNLPGFLVRPVAPLKLPTIHEIQLQDAQSVHQFLTHHHVKPQRVVQYTTHPELLFFFVKMAQRQILFPSYRKKEDTLAFSKQKTVPGVVQSVLSLLTDREDVSSMQQTIRLSSVLQDYVLYALSQFLHAHPEFSLETMDHWLDLFLKESTRIVADAHIYPPMEDVPVYFTDNVKGLIKNGRVLMAGAVQGKIRFLIRWFMTRREGELRDLWKRREVPSYYQYTSDFRPQPHQVVYNSIFPVSPLINYAYETQPLDKLSKNLNEPFYYYNVYETGMKPALMMRVTEEARARQVAYQWDQGMGIGSYHTPTPAVVLDTSPGVEPKGRLWTSEPHALGRLFPAIDNTWLIILPLRMQQWL